MTKTGIKGPVADVGGGMWRCHERYFPPSPVTSSSDSNRFVAHNCPMDSVAIRRVEPVMEELTGPFALAAFGGLLLWLPSLSVGPISSSRILGLVAVAGGMFGLTIHVVRHVRRMARPVRVTPLLPAPEAGESGPIPGLIVNEISGTSGSLITPADEPEDLPRAA